MGCSGEMLMTCTYTHPPRLRIIINSHDWYPNKLSGDRQSAWREIECVDNANSLTHGRQAIGCTSFICIGTGMKLPSSASVRQTMPAQRAHTANTARKTDATKADPLPMSPKHNLYNNSLSYLLYYPLCSSVAARFFSFFLFFFFLSKIANLLSDLTLSTQA